MILVVIAAIVFVAWPESRPVVAVLAGLTALGWFLPQRERRGHAELLSPPMPAPQLEPRNGPPSLVEQATGKLDAFSAASEGLTPEQKDKIRARRFNDLTSEEEHAAVAAMAEAIGGVYDRAAGTIDMVGSRPEGLLRGSQDRLVFGGRHWTRTSDLLHVKQVL